DDEVIGIGPYFSRVGVEQGHVLRLGRSERMVHGMKPFRLLIPFQQRKIEYPQGGENISVAQSQTVAHEEAQFVELFPGAVCLTRENKDKVPFSCAGLFYPRFEVFRRVKLVD